MGVYKSKLMRPNHSKVEIRLLRSDNYENIIMSRFRNLKNYFVIPIIRNCLFFFMKFLTILFVIRLRPKQMRLVAFYAIPRL